MAIVQHFIYFLQSAASFQGWDIQKLKQINLHRLTALDDLFLFITNSAAFINYGVPVCLLIYGLLKNKASLRKEAILILLSVIVSNTISEILKYTVNRPRPFLSYSFIQQLTPASSPSFPSGHTAIAAAMAIAFSLIYRQVKLRLTVFIWALSVGYSRMDLGVHYPSDIIASFIIAFVVCLILYYLYKKMIKNQYNDKMA